MLGRVRSGLLSTFAVLSVVGSVRAAPGQTCAQPSECDATAPFCVDGVCCTTACDTTCVACAAPLKESLVDSGTCGPALSGLDPHDDCAQSVQSSCGTTGACDGKGACMLYPQGTSCKTLPAHTNECVIEGSKGQICSGNGACYPETSPSGVECKPYRCKNGACAFPCATDDDCQPPNRCENGVCKPKRPNGKPCATLLECASGNCTDGVCCNSSCDGQCEACNLQNQVGTCSFVVGEPVAPRPPCDGTPPCQGACAGGSDFCAYPGASVSCAPASCTGDVATPAAGCDNAGQCASAASSPCNPYACDATSGACKTVCVSDNDCSQGAVCDTGSGKCATATATCADAFTVELPNGQQQFCEPYKCVGGKCQQQCVTTADCAPGFECDQPVCNPVTVTDAGTDASGGAGGSGAGESSDSAGGCGCSLPGRAPRSSAWLLLLALLLGSSAWRRTSRDSLGSPRTQCTSREMRLIKLLGFALPLAIGCAGATPGSETRRGPRLPRAQHLLRPRQRRRRRAPRSRSPRRRRAARRTRANSPKPRAARTRSRSSPMRSARRMLRATRR